MKKLIVGMSGASGAPITAELLRQLQHCPEIESELIMTDSAKLTLIQETGLTAEEFCALADHVYQNEKIGERPASGSYRTMGMVIVPCSMKTLAGVVSGYSENLLLRAADVTLKERRKLVMVTRECPFGTIHLRNMYEASKLGAIILPPMLSYYQKPQSVEDCTRHIVGKILDQFGIEGEGFRRWKGMEAGGYRDNERI